jgi:hypothetical protein
MLYGAEVAVCSEINANQIKTMWTENQFLNFKHFGAHNQYALKR